MRRLFVLIFLLLTVPAIAQTPGTVRFPANLDTSVSLFEVANRTTSTLNGAITSGATTLTLTSGATFPNSGAITIGAEIIYYTSKSTNVLNGLIRGQCGTTAAAASSGAVVRGNIIACHHQALRDAIIATQTKVGSGSSTPASGLFLIGTGAGTSSWQSLTGVPAVTFTVGNATPKAGNNIILNFSNDANKPGFRWNGTSSTIQFSNDGTNFFDIASGGSGLFGSGTIGVIPKFTGTSSLANSILSDTGSEILSSASLRANLTIAAGSCGVTGTANNVATFCGSFTNMLTGAVGLSNDHTLNASGASSQNHFGLTSNLKSSGSQNYSGIHIAGQFLGAHIGTGTAATVIGVKGIGSRTNTGNLTTLLTGVASEIQNVAGGGTITESRNFDAQSNFTTGTTTDHSAFYAGTPNVSGGTLTNYYGFRYQAGAGTNQWMLFTSSMTAKAQLGQVSIGNSGATYITNHASATTTWDPPSIADGAQTNTTVSVTGAAIGNPCICGFSIAVPAGAILACNITAAGTATVTLFNKTGAALDLASGTLRASFFAY